MPRKPKNPLVPDKSEAANDPTLQPWMCGSPKKTGGFCHAPKSTGRTRCRLHGGNTIRGPEHHNFKHGRRSVLGILRPELLEAAQATISNSSRLDLTDQLGLITALQHEAVEAWMDGGGGKAWGRLKQLRDAYQAEVRKGKDSDIKTMQAVVKEIMDLIDGESARVSARDQVISGVDMYRKIADTERKRITASQNSLTTEEIIVILGKVGDAITRLVPDRDIRQRIGDEIQSVVTAHYHAHIIDRAGDDDAIDIIETSVLSA